MQKYFFSLLALAFFISLGIYVDSYTISKHSSEPMFLDNGNVAEPFSIALSSTSATLIAPVRVRRSLLIQNPIGSGFSVALGTHSAFSLSGARLAELLPGIPFSTSASYAVYGTIFAGGSGISVIGVEELSAGD